MKKIKTVILVGCSALAVALPHRVKADTSLPPSQEVGDLMGYHMCDSLVKKGTFEAEGFGDALVNKYGEEKSLLVVEKMDTIFSSNKVVEDQYTLDFFKAFMSYIVNNDDCFKVFVSKTF